MTHGCCCRLGIRFMSILLGFNFCLHFTLPGIFSPQSLKSYLRLWHNQTIILSPDKWQVQNLKQTKPNAKSYSSSPSVNIMIIMIRFSANCNINKTSDWSPVAISVLWLVNTRGLSREVSGETPKAMFDQKSLCTVCCLCLGTWRWTRGLTWLVMRQCSWWGLRA